MLIVKFLGLNFEGILRILVNKNGKYFLFLILVFLEDGDEDDLFDFFLIFSFCRLVGGEFFNFLLLLSVLES